MSAQDHDTLKIGYHGSFKLNLAWDFWHFVMHYNNICMCGASLLTESTDSRIIIVHVDVAWHNVGQATVCVQSALSHWKMCQR